MSGLIYLAGAIDHVTGDDAISWRERCTAALTQRGIGTYSPASAFRVPAEAGPGVHSRVIDINLQALRLSTAVLANLSHRSFGTPVEVWLALTQLRIPVYAWGLSDRSLYHGFTRCWPGEAEAMAALLLWTEANPAPDPPDAPGFQAQQQLPGPHE